MAGSHPTPPDSPPEQPGADAGTVAFILMSLVIGTTRGDRRFEAAKQAPRSRGCPFNRRHNRMRHVVPRPAHLFATSAGSGVSSVDCEPEVAIRLLLPSGSGRLPLVWR